MLWLERSAGTRRQGGPKGSYFFAAFFRLARTPSLRCLAAFAVPVKNSASS